MKKVLRDTPLMEITLRRYERPDKSNPRELVKKFCLSIGLLQPGDSRDVVVDILLILQETSKIGAYDEGIAKFLEPFVKDGKLNSTIIIGSPQSHGPERARSNDGYYAIDIALFLGSFFGSKLARYKGNHFIKQVFIVVGTILAVKLLVW